MTIDIDDTLDRITGDAPLIQPLDDKVDKNAHLWARHPDDYYVEPEWVSQRLFETEHFEGTIVDPACGGSRIVRAGRAHRDRVKPLGDKRIGKVLGYDKVRRARECDEEEDFLLTDYETDNIVSNPPFRLCDKKTDFAFVRKALATAERKVALLLPLPWMTGADKGAWLKTTPFQKVLVITPRPSMPPGPVIEADLAPGGGTEDFAWYIWDHAHKGPPVLGWLNRDG